MGVVLQRNLGPVEHLSSGQFTVETATGRPALCCPLCGTITEVAPPHTIAIGGNVTPVWSCPRCPFVDFISLESIHEEVLR